MSQYDNSMGFEPSYKTRTHWLKIVKSDSEFSHTSTHFEMPALFKSVSPMIRIFWAGFIFIFILEGYATIGVAYTEGVPILVIGILIMIDIFLAYLPHIGDGDICLQKNNRFIQDFSWRYNRKTEDGRTKEQMDRDSKISAEQMRKLIISKKVKKNFLYTFLILSCFVKLYLFFQTYPFFNTYQAYIIIISYTLGAILHILCTGHVINYSFIFRPRLKKEWKSYIRAGGRAGGENGVNDFTALPHEQIINSTGEIILAKIGHQEIVKENDNYLIKTIGLLFDEELSLLINSQNTEAQKFAVAVSGKALQTDLLHIN
jgi:hypothetical protein